MWHGQEGKALHATYLQINFKLPCISKASNIDFVSDSLISRHNVLLSRLCNGILRAPLLFWIIFQFSVFYKSTWYNIFSSSWTLQMYKLLSIELSFFLNYFVFYNCKKGLERCKLRIMQTISNELRVQARIDLNGCTY